MEGIDTYQATLGVITNENGDDMGANTASQLFMVKDGTISYLPHNITLGGHYSYNSGIYSQMTDNMLYSNLWRKVNPYITAPLADYSYRLANCSPTLTSLCIWDTENGELPEFFIDELMESGLLSFGYAGRAGESILVDGLTFHDNALWKGDILEFEVQNDNVSIDGRMPGFNKTLLGCNVSLPDWAPPTVQILQFLKEDAKVTDRFENPEDGNFMFYAGDFRIIYDDEGNGMMGVFPMDEVKVEYAPSGSDLFTEFTVMENPDKFFMPGYGYCYDGKLSEVDKFSHDGWFDMRITLKDTNGNYQIQTVSPAFYIGSLAGTENVRIEDELYKFENGRIISTSDKPFSIYSLDGKTVTNNTLQSGLYIVKSGSSVRKIIVP